MGEAHARLRQAVDIRRSYLAPIAAQSLNPISSARMMTMLGRLAAAETGPAAPAVPAAASFIKSQRFISAISLVQLIQSVL
jgi:hypothetical protein